MSLGEKNINHFYANCHCNRINILLPKKPDEICDCYCNICSNIHRSKFTSFARYSTSECGIKIGSKLFKKIRSSNYANRYLCAKCGQFIFMHYVNSPNIWFYTDTFQSDVTDVEHYDLYKN